MTYSEKGNAIFYPYNLWILMNMIQFDVAIFQFIIGTITQLEIFLKIDENRDIDSATIEQIRVLYDMLVKMGLSMSAKTAGAIKLHLDKSSKGNKFLREKVTDLMHRITDELQDQLFLTILPNKAKYYNPSGPIFGKDIVDKYPELTEDISEAGNCFALDRYTACVFHLMRIMEKTVQKYADKLGLPITFTCDKEWQIIINEIRGQLKKLYPKHADPDRIKYENILAQLETVKIAWRNPTMHPKATYTEDEAKAILNAIGIFIKDLIRIL